MPRISRDELIKLQKKFLIDRAIGKKLGISNQAVHQMRQRYGIPPLPASAWKAPFTARIPKDKLLELQKTFRTDKAIGEQYGVSETTASKIRIKYGIPTIALDNTKRNNRIVALYKKGSTARVIANNFGLTTIWVYTIIRKAGAGRRKLRKEMLAKKVLKQKRR